MASSKKRRKQIATDRKARQAGPPPRPPKDGDRRRRGPDQVRTALDRKRAIREWTIDASALGVPEGLADDPTGGP